MNYIKQLQAENEELTKEVAALKEMARDLYNHMHSEKFSCGDELDGYVSTSDVRTRMEAMI